MSRNPHLPGPCRWGDPVGAAAGMSQFDYAADGSFELTLGGPEQPRNWLALAPGASRITTRHYYEEERCAAADPNRNPALEIVPAVDAGPPPFLDDAGVAAGIRRISNFVRARTLEQQPMANRPQHVREGPPPAWRKP